MYDIGDKLRIQATFTLNAVPTDPTTITCTIRTGLSSIAVYTYGVSAEIIRSSAGIYYIDLTLACSGTWTYLWVGTGTVEQSEGGSFVVRAQWITTPVPFAAHVPTINAACKAAFGSSITYLYGSSSAYTVTVIEMDPNNMEIESPETRVVLLAESADFSPAPGRQDHLLLGTQEYRVYDIREADSEGGIYLYGEKV